MKLLSLLIGLLWAGSALAGSLPQNYTVKEHSYLWRADGSSSTQGTGSIFNYPTLTNSTATATLSQVTTASVPTLPNSGGTLPGSGSLIKAVISGGASGGTIQMIITVPSKAISSLGNFGFYWHQDSNGNTAVTGLNFYLAETGAFSKYFRFVANSGSSVQRRREGWNHFVWQRGDETQNAGSFSYDGTSIVRLRFDFTVAANQSTTIYLSDILYGFYAKPQIVVWSADQVASGEPYASMFPYMQARNIPGTYAPVLDWLKSPSGGQMTLAQLQEMVAAGWSVDGHNTAGQNYTALTGAQLQSEVDTIYSYYRANGLPISKVWCFDGGNHNALVDSIMAANGITHGYNGNTASDKNGRFLYGGLINQYNLWSVAADSLTDTEVITAINHAIKYGEHLGILYHDTNAYFTKVIDYLSRMREANVLDVTTFERLVTRQASPRWAR